MSLIQPKELKHGLADYTGPISWDWLLHS